MEDYDALALKHCTSGLEAPSAMYLTILETRPVARFIHIRVRAERNHESWIDFNQTAQTLADFLVSER